MTAIECTDSRSKYVEHRAREEGRHGIDSVERDVGHIRYDGGRRLPAPRAKAMR